MSGSFWRILALGALGATRLAAVAGIAADIGPPPPSMDFALEFLVPETPVLSAEVFLCDDSSCRQRAPFGDPPGWQGRAAIVGCREDRCWAFAGGIGFRRYHQLVLEFDDGTRESNVFTKVAYGANYQVVVAEDGLYVRELPPDSFLAYFSPAQYLLFVPGAAITLIAETTVARIYARKTRLQVRGVAVANLLSLPPMWFLLPFLRVNFGVLLLLGEGFAILFESGFLHLANRRTQLSLRQSTLASLIMNSASIVAGVVTILAVAAVSNIGQLLT
jgi:hypothetical protein